jgi:hypothetical protein
MNQARFVYRYEENPSKGWALTGALFGLKFLVAIPHLLIVNILQNLAMLAAYIGYFVVAFTGQMPQGIQAFTHLSLRWSARTYGWIIGYTDTYPPFETEPAGYPVEAEIPRNDAPNKGWAVAGIFFIKILALIPHFVIGGIVILVSFFAAWIGYLGVLFTGAYPRGIGDFVAGAVQWWLRVASWMYGLTDEYPPFALDARPSA